MNPLIMGGSSGRPCGSNMGSMDPGHRSTVTTPRWARVFGVIAIVLAFFVLFVALAGVGGQHGPARHMPSGTAGAETPWGLIALFAVLAMAAVALNWRAPWAWFAVADWPHATMPAPARKFALTAHVTASVGSLGAVAVFLALGVAGLISEDMERIRACYIAMELTTRFVIVPLILGSLVTGLVSALGTTWGLVQHYWVLVKLLLNIVVLLVVLLQMESISYIAAAARDARLSAVELFDVRRSLVTHGAGGLVVLIVATILGIYKPRGLTPYGALKGAREP
jgi:hypothetical protein